MGGSGQICRRALLFQGEAPKLVSSGSRNGNVRGDLGNNLPKVSASYQLWAFKTKKCVAKRLGEDVLPLGSRADGECWQDLWLWLWWWCSLAGSPCQFRIPRTPAPRERHSAALPLILEKRRYEPIQARPPCWTKRHLPLSESVSRRRWRIPSTALLLQSAWHAVTMPMPSTEVPSSDMT